MNLPNNDHGKNYIDIISQDIGIKSIKSTVIKHPYFADKSYSNSIKIVGGAVIDLIEGRKPKDYDIIISNMYNLNEMLHTFIDDGWDFLYESGTSITFKRNDILVQFIKTDINTFNYTIETSNISIYCDSIELEFDNISHKTKKLRPTPYTFSNPDRAIQALSRVPHWNKKGYELPEETYIRLLCFISDNIVKKTHPELIKENS